MQVSFLSGMNNTSQSMGVGQPHHPVNHTRPFFYVQPPSQPYFMYQWPMNPYGHYGFPGPGKFSVWDIAYCRLSFDYSVTTISFSLFQLCNSAVPTWPLISLCSILGMWSHMHPCSQPITEESTPTSPRLHPTICVSASTSNTQGCIGRLSVLRSKQILVIQSTNW